MNSLDRRSRCEDGIMMIESLGFGFVPPISKYIIIVVRLDAMMTHHVVNRIFSLAKECIY